MTTIVVQVPDNKSEYVYNILREIPFAKIKSSLSKNKTINIMQNTLNGNNSSEINELDLISLKELLKEGYLASQKEDIEISKDFAIIDSEHWD